MKEERILSVLGMVNETYILEAMNKEKPARKPKAAMWASMVACVGLIVTLTMLSVPGILKGPGNVTPPPVPDPVPVVSGGEAQPSSEPIQPPTEQRIVINWDGVAVNEVDQLVTDAAMYYDPELYDKETWGETEIIDYYGWILAPNYIPEGLTGGGNPMSGTVIRSKESGELVQDQMGRGFWSDYYEDGSPKSDDELYIPTGFTLVASRLHIFKCGILPVDETETTSFNDVPVTIIHCSMPHGPFDPNSYAPNGLYHTPAGYYDIYKATFELDGVQYEITTQRLELEEMVKIVASVIGGYSRQEVTVG